jgi:phosphatidylglycerol:prolipoprotein diacylglycerol transferase
MPLFLTFPDWIKPEIIPQLSWLPLRWYGLMYVLAFITTYWLFTVQVKRSGLQVPRETISNFFFSGLAGLLIGARVFATLIYNPDRVYFMTHPWMIFSPWDKTGQFTGFAGMSFHGGLLGTVVGMYTYARVKKLDVLQWADWVFGAFPLGYTFGRLGNFINDELWGRATLAPWGMVFPSGTPLPVSEPWVKHAVDVTGVPIDANGMANLPRHPSQLYEAFGEGILLWLVLWFVFRNRAPFKGFLIGAYLIGYGIVRFVIEYFRNPDKDMDFIIVFQPGTSTSQLDVPLFNFSMGQILCFIMIVAGIVSWWLIGLYHKNKSLLAQAADKKVPRKGAKTQK